MAISAGCELTLVAFQAQVLRGQHEQEVSHEEAVAGESPVMRRGIGECGFLFNKLLEGGYNTLVLDEHFSKQYVQFQLVRQHLQGHHRQQRLSGHLAVEGVSRGLRQRTQPSK